MPSCNNVEDGVECCSRESNKGWRYLLFTLGAITIAIFILRYFVFRFRETPKYLIYRGRDADAIRVLQHMAKTNGQECGLSVESFEMLQTDRDTLSSDSSASSNQPVLGGSRKKLQASWIEKIKLETAKYNMLFYSFQMARLTVLVWLTYIMDFWGFTVAGMYQ